MIDRSFRKKIAGLPREPGVYSMKDSSSNVIYVGKAKDLKSRVSSYFIDSKDHSPKTRKLVKSICDFEIIIVNNEVEALLLERTLIKHHQPHFNILLRDDKEYPYVRIHFGDEWPRLDIVRRRTDDGAEYFGPFSASGSLRQGLDAVNKVFPLIRCTPWEFKHAKRVCTYFHMKMCLGPCVNPIEKQTYHSMLRDAIDLISGKNIEVMEKISKKMQNASNLQQFELAAQFRDQLKAIGQLKEKQAMMLDPTIDADVIGWKYVKNKVYASVLMIRYGKVMGHQNYILNNEGIEFDEGIAPESLSVTQNEDLTQFLLQYYDNRDVPSLIAINQVISDPTYLSQAIAGDHDRAITICSVDTLAKDPWYALRDIVNRNIDYQLAEHERSVERSHSALEAVRITLGLTSLPNRIECIDISNLQGTAIVASNVCFVNGKPEKSLYRIYNIETVTEGPDDFKSIYEVVRRRIIRGIKDIDLPDLLIIDGGKGQLDSALSALAEFPETSLNIVSLAKSRFVSNKAKDPVKKMGHNQMIHSFERVFKPNEPLAIPLPVGSPAYRLFTSIRDEAHRFAITKHRAKRSKISQASPLDSIPGIGPKIRAKLLVEFQSLENIAKASIDQLLKIKGINESSAEKLLAVLKSRL
ncbi:MAG: excinuclease ABC subunit UvrC [Proteobacteria bacterium]|nr:excinuclease ABC subunit UvrC [Pseudomonadota bacterium]